MIYILQIDLARAHDDFTVKEKREWRKRYPAIKNISICESKIVVLYKGVIDTIDLRWSLNEVVPLSDEEMAELESV